MESAQNGITAYVLECRSEQYQIFCEDYDRHNALQWFCDSCKDQNKEITQSEKCITWGKMKDLKKIRKRS